MLGNVVGLGTQIGQGEVDIPAAKAAVSAGTLLIPYPSGVINRALQGMKDFDQRAETSGEVAAALGLIWPMSKPPKGKKSAVVGVE